ncbi:MAG: exodeoxyribonuclease VII small subunit [Candidatus Riflebacteria bacterium]|nr:exodeoxyribonuclease VII small subunit [Candidatus Riflebacteria bacterium]
MPQYTQKEIAKIVAMSKEDIEKLDYETAMSKLEIVVDALEQEGTSLEYGLQLYAVGTALSKKCSAALDAAEEKMLQLLGTIQNPSETPFDPEREGR